MQRSPRSRSTRLMLLALAIASLAPMLLSNSACTAIGYAIGSAITRDDPPRIVSAGTGLSASPGTPMAIATKDSARMLGVYIGHEPLDPATYAVHYERWRARTPGAPALGADVVLMRGSREEHVAFLGFGYRAVHVRREGRRPEDVSFSRLRSLRGEGGAEWTRDQLAALDARGELPSRIALLLGRGLPVDWNRHYSKSRGITGDDLPTFHDTTVVATDRIAQIEVPSARGARTACTLVGLAVDATLVLAVAAAASFDAGLDFSGCSASPMGGFSMASLAPPPTTQDFDVLAGAFVADSSGVAPAPAAEHAAPALDAPATH